MIKETAILVKTEQGRAVLKERLGLVRPPQRAILVLVDGRSTVRQLKPFLVAAKANDDTFDELLAMGLVELAQNEGAAPRITAADKRKAADRFNEVYEAMVTLTASFLGLRGYFMQLKLERCETLLDLEGLWPELVRAITARHGEVLGKSALAILENGS